MNIQALRANFDVYLGDDGIIYGEIFKASANSDESTELARLECQSVQKVLIENPKSHYPLLVDLTRISKDFKSMSREARQAYASLMKEKQIIRVALVGDNIFLKITVGFIATAAKMKNRVRWFSSIEPAREWLLSAIEKG